MTPPPRRMEAFSDRHGTLRPFPSPPDVEDAARRAVVAHVLRNAPQATNDELRDQVGELLDMLDLRRPPLPRRRS